MSLENLTSSLLVRAIRIFLGHAYPSATIPESRRHFQHLSEDQPLGQILTLKGAEKLPSALPDGPSGYAFRVGSEDYQHLKLTVQPCTAAPGFVFAVDAHDLFQLLLDSSEIEAVEELRRRNRELACRIQQSWDEAGLPTQAGLLRGYLKQVLAPTKRLAAGNARA